MPNRPEWDLAAVIKSAIEQRLGSLHTGLVARVVSYNATKQRCVVQPEVMYHQYAEDGSYESVRMPQLVDVPVKWMRFGGFRIVGPLNEGDRVWVSFSEVSLDRWKARGGDTEPGDERRFHISDAVCYPGVYDAASAIGDAPTSHMSIGGDNGAPSISIDGSEVRVGGDTASLHAAQAETLQLALKAFATAASTFAATCVGPTSAQLAAFQGACTTLEALNCQAVKVKVL